MRFLRRRKRPSRNFYRPAGGPFFIPAPFRKKASRKNRITVKPAWVAATVVGVFILITGLAMLTGNWNSIIGEKEYSRRIKDIDNPIYQHNQGSAPQENTADQWREHGGGAGAGLK